MKTQLLLSIIILFFISAILPPSTSLAQDFPDVCQQPENILPNCNFDSGLDHWQTFIETGSANFSVLQGGGGCHAPLCPAAYIVTNDHFVGGLYQQVPVTPGNNYYANIVWLVFDSLANDEAVHNATGGIGRRIGIDPFGGTDSRSPNVVWSTDNWRNDCKICNIEYVTVTAQADTITVFLRLDDTWKVRAAEKGFPVPPSDDQFWIDDIGLKQVGEAAAVIQAPSPTETPIPQPPTDTPAPALPTDTPLPPTETAKPEIEIAQVDTPTPEPEPPTATPTNTDTPPPPPPTLTPSSTPSPTTTPRARPSATVTRIRRITPTPESSELPLVLGAVGTTACLGGLALLIVAIIMVGLVWLYRLGWSSNEDDGLEFDEEGISTSHVE